MRRREYVRAIGGATSVTILGGLAGCSGDGDSGGAPGPFSVRIKGPYAYQVNSNLTSVYARLILTDPPNNWPEDGYYSAWTRRKGTEGSAMSAVYNGRTEPNYRFEKSAFEDDGKEAVNASMDDEESLDSGTTFEFLLRSPETEEFINLGELTYEGEPTKRTPEEPP